jgi:hypothetical protein
VVPGVGYVARPVGASLIAAIAVATARETYKLPLRVIDGQTDPAVQSQRFARREVSGAGVS